MIKAFAQALKVSGVNSSVLVLGESGVGKGVIAELIHKNSGRAEKPLIKLNCGAIPENLIESELFGYEKGAFTGAQRSKPGYFEMADGGILFLDEIAELPLPSQVKLLHFLEDGQIMRLGGTKSTAVDVRIIAATHRNLEGMVREGAFRVDLYYRLNVIPIHVPALRERPDCILPMIHHYLDHFGSRIKEKKRLSKEALEVLLSYDYPGNVRELINLCERLVVMSEFDLIEVSDLPSHLINRPVIERAGVPDVWPVQMSLEQIMESVERDLLSQARKRYANQARLAEGLGVNQSTITRKLRRYGIQ
jgi:TyrR family helix-turn-helix protein